MEQVLRSLSIHPTAAHLGQAFQGHAAVRRITEADHRLLSAAAASLALEPRARLLPEERLDVWIGEFPIEDVTADGGGQLSKVGPPYDGSGGVVRGIERQVEEDVPTVGADLRQRIRELLAWRPGKRLPSSGHRLA